MVRNNVKDKLGRSLAVLVLSALLFPFCVSAQCGECDDRDPCTEDYCNGTQCLHAPKSCGDGSLSTWKPFGLIANFSTPEKIGDTNANISMPSNNGAGFNAAVSCNDGNPCTTDYYGANGCVHDQVNCDDKNPCTIDYCGPNGCVHDQVNCDDKNPCTTDYCGPNGCVHDPLICADGNAGVADASGSCGCVNPFLSSDSRNASTYESEVPDVSEIGIVHSAENVISNESQSDKGNASTVIFCSDGDFCDDGNESTIDYCVAGACINEPGIMVSRNNSISGDLTLGGENNSTSESIDQGVLDGHSRKIDGNNSCRIDKDCDDKNITTFDYCYKGECYHSPTSCDDNKPCTTDSYNGTACKNVPKRCGSGKTCIDGTCKYVDHPDNVYYPYYIYYPYTYPYTEPYSYNQPIKSYIIPAGTAITLPWGAKATALDTLEVENGIAYPSASPLRFVRDLGRNQAVSGYQSNLLISDQAEMIGLSWQTSTFTVVLIQPDGSVLPLKGDNQNVLHLMGSNYDYYYLRSPAKGNWNVEIRPANPGTGGEGFSLITGLVRGAAPLPSA